MEPQDSHASDQQLLQELDGELSSREGRMVREHLQDCWRCRARRLELENTIADFVRAHEAEELPPIAGPRAMLRARLDEIAATGERPREAGLWALGTAACVLLAAALLFWRPGYDSPQRARIVTVPDASLTPGAAVLLSQTQLCVSERDKNKEVSPVLQRRVFQAYGIPGAEPKAYEVDYLITPALGGADDIRNLWPHSYTATEWNALVKDALEDRLREMVCEGNLDLAAAQREIAADWIAAYKKYFHTEQPLAEHYRQVSVRH